MTRTSPGTSAPAGGDPPCWAHLPQPQVYELVRREVAARRPVDERERRSVATFLEHFDRLESPFDEDASPFHVTGSCVIVGARGVVLHRHARLGIWVQPGGHIDAGEAPWEAALREGREETGLPLRLVTDPEAAAGSPPPLLHVDVHPGPRSHTHLDVRYLVESDDVDPSPGAGESPDVHWFDWEAAIDIADEGLRGLLRSMRAQQPAE